MIKFFITNKMPDREIKLAFLGIDILTPSKKLDITERVSSELWETWKKQYSNHAEFILSEEDDGKPELKRRMKEILPPQKIEEVASQVPVGSLPSEKKRADYITDKQILMSTGDKASLLINEICVLMQNDQDALLKRLQVLVESFKGKKGASGTQRFLLDKIKALGGV